MTRGAAVHGRPPFFLACVAAIAPVLACSAACAAAFAGDVSARTAVAAYRTGEPVSIVMTNGSGRAVCTPAKSADPGKAVRNFEVKNPRGIWDAFFLESRRGSGEEFASCGELKPGESLSFSWEPKVLEKGSLQRPGPGRYRLTVIYLIKVPGKPSVFKTAKTNEFTIE
jgi:hypothetical protein